jgi:phosphoglycolate phosphatase-like HAD superfamily hydrolase
MKQQLKNNMKKVVLLMACMAMSVLGWASITVTGVGTAQELEEAAADMIVDSVSELTYILCDREV